MSHLTPDARLRLDLYLTGVRRAVAGTSVDPEEVERDIRDHVDSALRNTEAPVSRASLDEVLARLGDPAHWVPDEEIPAWRRVWRRIAYGPEEWRLPYLAFALTLVGVITAPLGGLLLIIPAWIVSRAALDLPSGVGTETARKWLLYPSLILVSLMIAMMMLAGLAIPLLVWGIEFRGVVHALGLESLRGAELFRPYAGFVLVSFAAWWLVLAGLVAIFIRPVRWMFRPFADGLRRGHMIVLAIVATLMGVAGALILPMSWIVGR